MNFFQVYQYVAPLILFPVSLWLWSQRYGADLQLALISLSIPVVFAYVIPGIGTNLLRLWEFNTRFRLGRFRPHHGLVFGSATSLFALVTLTYPGEPSWGAVARDGFVLGSVLAFWNWLYDTYAIKAGFIKVYTRKQFEGAGAEEIATDYAPILFGTFGFCFGVAIRSLEYAFVSRDEGILWPLVLGCHVVCLATPVLAFVTFSLVRTGETGLRSYERISRET